MVEIRREFFLRTSSYGSRKNNQQEEDSPEKDAGTDKEIILT